MKRQNDTERGAVMEENKPYWEGKHFSFYTNKVNPEDRSMMNVPFVTPSAELDAKFVKEAEGAGLVSLKGHRLAGGMRASIYNAMPVEGVKALIDFMKKFELANK